MDIEYEDDAFIVEDEKQYVILVIYDIVDNKCRNRMVKFLEGYGVRVQKSAFEAYLTKKRYEKMVKIIHHFINKETDSLRIYFLDNSLAVRSWGVGDKHLDEIIII